jgi:hypothetical protein
VELLPGWLQENPWYGNSKTFHGQKWNRWYNWGRKVISENWKWVMESSFNEPDEICTISEKNHSFSILLYNQRGSVVWWGKKHTGVQKSEFKVQIHCYLTMWPVKNHSPWLDLCFHLENGEDNLRVPKLKKKCTGKKIIQITTSPPQTNSLVLELCP